MDPLTDGDANSVLMERMTWPEIADAVERGRPAILPVGSIEQHGPHLPLATDCLLPLSVALEVSTRLPLVIAPPITYGAKSRPLSGGGESFPGTLSLRGTTLLAIVEDVVSALARTGFTRICVQNWHTENSGYLWEACDAAVARHPGIRVVLIEDSLPTFSEEELDFFYPNGFPGWDVEHAAIMETSMMLVTQPHLVRRDRVVDDEAERHPGWDVLPAPDAFVPRSGVLWHATEASEEKGRRFLDRTAAKLEQALRTEFDL